MTDRTHGYADAIVALAQAEDALDVVDAELVTVARTVDGNRDLGERLSDTTIPVSQRLTFVEAEALQAAHPATRAALAMLIAADRILDLEPVSQQVSESAATLRERDLAEVYVATALDADQTDRLRRALEQATGKSLDVQVHVDESVVGGVRARVGDTVIDGSLATRLQDVRTRLRA